MLKIQFPHNPSNIGGPSSFQTRFIDELNNNNKIIILPPNSKIKPDLIFVIGGTKRFFWLLYNKFIGVEILHRIDGLDSNFQIDFKNLKFNFLKIIRNLNVILIANVIANKIVFQSEFIKKFWNNFLFVKKKSIIIYNGVNINTYKPNGNSREKDIICIEGSVNSDYAVSILNSIDKYKVTLIGHVEKKYLNKIKNKNINILGIVKRDDIPYFLNQHKIYLCLEPNPPCPNSVIEAMSCGLPIIGFNSGSLNELVKNSGKLATLHLNNNIPSNNSLIELNTMISNCLEYDFQMLSINARNNVINEYNIKYITSKYLKFIFSEF
jgi:glycosyltransferase involved in cell wall biosynthesis